MNILRGNILLKRKETLLELFKPRMVSDAASSYAEVLMHENKWASSHQMTNRINFYRIILFFLIMPQERSRPRCSSPSDPVRKSQNKREEKTKAQFLYVLRSGVFLCIFFTENYVGEKGGKLDHKCCKPDLNTYFPHEHHGSICTKPQIRHSHFELLVVVS